MTVAYNSAYIQTETLNFTFARQAVIVQFSKLFQKLVKTVNYLINVYLVTFLN